MDVIWTWAVCVIIGSQFSLKSGVAMIRKLLRFGLV
jgi:hypothetical protein